MQWMRFHKWPVVAFALACALSKPLVAQPMRSPVGPGMPLDELSPDGTDVETQHNLDIFSSLMTRGSRPLFAVRPKGFSLGGDLSVIKPPQTTTRGLADAAKKYGYIIFPAIDADFSSNDSQDSVGLMYLTANPVPQSSAKFVTARYGHEMFTSMDKSFIVGAFVNYTSLDVQRTVQISNEDSTEILAYKGYGALGVIAYEPGGKDTGLIGKNPAFFSLIPYAGMGYWSYTTLLDADFTNVHIHSSQAMTFYEGGLSLCIRSGELCSSIDMTADATVGQVLMLTMHVRR